MKKLLTYLVFGITYTTASAASFNVDYSTTSAKAQNTHSQLSGVGIGISSSTHLNGWYGRLDVQHSNKWDADYLEIQGGYQHNFYDSPRTYVLGKIGVGFAHADIEGYRNTNQFITVPLGLEVGFRPSEKVELYANAGYKWAFDITSDNTCKDGSSSNSNSHGTCSWHGGVSHESDKVGTVKGSTINVGLRYNF